MRVEDRMDSGGLDGAIVRDRECPVLELDGPGFEPLAKTLRIDHIFEVAGYSGDVVHVGSGKFAGAGLIPDLSSSTRCQTLADRCQLFHAKEAVDIEGNQHGDALL